MAPPKDIARSYPKRGLTADVGFRSEPKFCGDGSVKLDGSTQGATSATSYSAATSGAKTTLACWVNPRDLSGSNRTMVGNCVNNATDNMALYQTGTNEMDAIIYYGSGLNLKFAAKNLDENRWYFVAATFDYDATTFKFYVDGVEFSDTPSLGYGGTAGLFEIGFRDDSGGDIQHVNANFAHVMMIEDVLTQSEIVELMRDTSYAKAQTFGTVNRYYVLDADFNDSTGSHNATSVGSPSFTVDRPQLPRGLDLARGAAMARVYTGRAVDFDGSADYLRNSATVPSITGAGAQASICAWVNFDSASGGIRNIASFCNTANDDGIVIYQNNAEIGVAVFNNAPTVREKALTSVSTSRWFFVVGTWDKDTASQKVYVDGVRGSGNMSVGIGIEAGTDIGARSSATPQYYFDGQIAGVKYFDVELTQNQIRELYHNPEQVLPTGVSASNLRRYYPLSDYNDATAGGMGGRYFQDMGADGEPAVDQGSATMAFAQPVPCPQLGLQQSATRLRFPTTTNNYVQASISPVGANFTLSYWVQPFSLHTGLLYQSTSGLQQVYTHSSGNVHVYSINGVYAGSETYTAGDWLHVVVTTDGLYVNGVFDEARTGTIGLNQNGIRIGADASSPNTNFGFNGIIASVAIWDEAITASEVSALYAQGQGYDPRIDTGNYTSSANLINLWLMDDLTTVVDRVGSSNATVTGSAFTAASFPENASGSTIVGDFSMKRKGVSVLNPTATPLVTGVMAGAQIANDGSLNIDPANGGHTVSFFIRVEMGSASGGIMLAPAVGTSGANWHFCYFTSTINSVPPRLQIGDGTTTYQNYIWPAAITNPEEWHQLAYTVDFSTSPTTFRLYLDGALVSTQAAYTHAAIDSGDVMNVGSNGSGALNFPGAIACLKMYQAKLSDDEVEQIYRSDLRLIKGLNNE